MLIKKIIIKYSDVAGGHKTAYKFTESRLNLISSAGINSKGKTSLIRFIIWGLGFNVSLTSEFSPSYAETEIRIGKSNISRIIRKGNSVDIFFNKNNKKSSLLLPDDEPKVEKLIFNDQKDDICKQLIGYFYFEQDSGYSTWNRGIVIQQLNNNSILYKINIDSLIASTIDIDYDNYLQKKNHYTEASDATLGLTKAITVAKDLNDVQIKENKKEAINQISDKISQLVLQLTRVQNKEQIYVNNIKDYNAFYKLLEKLALHIHYKGKIIEVTKNNVIQDPRYLFKLNGYKAYYSDLEQKLKQKINDLKKNRSLLLTLSKNNQQMELVKAEDNYKNIQTSLLSTGISVEDSQKVHNQMTSLKKECIHDFKNNIVESKAYTDIWNNIVGLAKDIHSEKTEFKEYFDLKDNKLLVRKLPLSGAERILAVLVYRLGILQYLEKKLDIQLPIILDSPASQEMDKNNLALVISMLKKDFKNHQIIIATNQEVSVTKEMNKILITNGVVKTMK